MSKGQSQSVQAAASVATIGFFDGVHRGHQYLIRQVAEEAQRRGMATTLISFPDHPARLLHPERQLQLLTTPPEKAELLALQGAQHLVLLPFTAEIAQMSARQFMEKVLRDRLGVRVLVIGYDHRFGHQRSEGFADYVRHGQELGIEVVQARELDCQMPDGQSVSSSFIRKALLAGDVELAAKCLGYTYFVRGQVVGGFQVGRKIGFPTANLLPDSPDKLIPKGGVYDVGVVLEDGREAHGMLNIGTRPTLHNGHERSIEVHIFDFNGDLYAENLEIRFRRFIREERKFDSIDELQAQLKLDEIACKS